MAALTEVREISKIAYGFMGSQALVAALDIALFGHLAGGARTGEQLAQASGVRADRLDMLLTPLTGLGLLVRDANSYVNAPATQKYLVPDAPEYFGEYIRLQVGRQIYPHAMRIDRMLAGTPARIYEQVANSAEQAADFSHSQHLGSLGPAYLLARALDIKGPGQLLDVAGGSGAFTIQLCKKFPDLHATILDFPAVVDVAKTYIEDAGLQDRVTLLAGNALDTAWPDDNDIVLMSYLLSAVGSADIDSLFEHAFAALRPGGHLVVHDFMVADDKSGPATAALWMLVLAGAEDPLCLTAGEIEARTRKAGFAGASSRDLVPTITGMLVARKPG